MTRIRTGFRVLLGAATASALLVVAAGSADAQGADVTATPLVGATDTIVFVNPCTGETGTSTITFTGVFHQVVRPTGTFMAVNNVAGDFVFVPDNPASQVITGHFASVAPGAGGSDDVLGTVLHAEGLASDGTKVSLHFITHHTENGLGLTVVDFAKGCD
jgi:hypothetical protein